MAKKKKKRLIIPAGTQWGGGILMEPLDWEKTYRPKKKKKKYK